MSERTARLLMLGGLLLMVGAAVFVNWPGLASWWGRVLVAVYG